MGETPERTDDDGPGPIGDAVAPRSERPRLLVTLVLLAAAAACYVSIVAVRLGPPSGGDTVPLTAVTTALADGDLRVAASAASLPNPPGYPLLAAPFVAAFPSAVGSPSWCTPPGRLRPPAVGQRSVGSVPDGVVECDPPNSTLAGILPPWYQAQGLLGVASWLVLAVGALAVLRAARADSLGRQAGMLAFLAFLPAASSAIVQLYHPQDVVSLGLALAGLSQTLRRRWLLAGVLFGAAVLTKQFAILLLLPALVAAPDRRSRVTLAAAALGVFAAGILPFLVVDARATLENLSGFSAGGAAAGHTVLSLAGVHGTVASAVARDAPVVFALAVCTWASRRLGPIGDRPTTLVSLALVCTGSRLVFESVVFPYYLLAASVLVLVLDLVARRSPHWSLAWCAAAAFFVALHPGNRAIAAFGTLALAAAVVALGFHELLAGARSPGDRGLAVIARGKVET